MNVVRGNIVLEETGVPVSGVVVVVEGLAGSSASPGVIAERAPATGGAPVAEAGGGAAVAVAPVAVAPPTVDLATAPRAALGSRVAADGSFEIEYDSPDGAGTPLFLHLSVLAPDAPGSALESRTLYSSTDLRPAGGTDEYLVAIPADALTKAGIPLPPDASLATQQEQASTVIAKLQNTVDFHTSVGDQARGIAAQLVTAARTASAAIDAARLHLKPSIPLTGDDGIPRRDELELERILDHERSPNG